MSGSLPANATERKRKRKRPSPSVDSDGTDPERTQPGRFYGRPTSKSSTWKARLARIRASVEEIKTDEPLPNIVDEDLTKRRLVWKQFFRQEEAFLHCDRSRADLKCFSFEQRGCDTGQRRFLTSTYSAFIERYFALPPDARHFYELIRQGYPAKLYFDLEFQRECNPQLTEADDAALVADFIRFVLAQLHAAFPSLPLPEEGRASAAAVINLDSSTAAKFSRHLVFPDVVFLDNLQQGNFIADLVRDMVAATDQDGTV